MSTVGGKGQLEGPGDFPLGPSSSSQKGQPGYPTAAQPPLEFLALPSPTSLTPCLPPGPSFLLGTLTPHCPPFSLTTSGDRGRSVRATLQQALPEHSWTQTGAPPPPPLPKRPSGNVSPGFLSLWPPGLCLALGIRKTSFLRLLLCRPRRPDLFLFDLARAGVDGRRLGKRETSPLQRRP